jgi:hypothetical protein
LDEEALIIWQDVLDEVLAGRTQNLVCPHCKQQPLEVTEEGMRTRIRCTRCNEYIEGTFG